MIYLWITNSHLFVCLPTLELTTFEQQVCSTKIGYGHASLGTNIWKKRNVVALNSAHQTEKQCNLGSGWLERQQYDLHASSESCEPKRFVRCCNKVEKNYIQEKQPNQFHYYSQNIGFVNRMDQNVAKCWYPNEKWWWFPFVWMVDVVI